MTMYEILATDMNVDVHNDFHLLLSHVRPCLYSLALDAASRH